MNFKGFDWYSWLVISGVGVFLSLFFLLLGSCYEFNIGCYGLLNVWGNFSFDGVSFYLSVLSFILWVSLLSFWGLLSGGSRFMLSLSVVFSLGSYCCVNSLFFWGFYELSILPLLFLLVKESPYSERYVAAWYLLGYVVLTSLPMLLCIFYISLEGGSFNMLEWFGDNSVNWGVLVLLGVMFMTKIPLPPFHVWLPIVHAEASSAVSVCLSGYIMKLGLLGVVRFCFFVVPEVLFNSYYLMVCLALSVLFFFSACRELDGKRWLAFLSLSHILMAALCLCVCSWDNSGLSFLFCLGHGLSAGVVFMLLWVVYEVCGSRNWVVLKACLPESLYFRCLSCACLCTVGSLPPTVQFFSEVLVLSSAGFKSWGFMFLLFIYLFMGGLVPLFLLGTLLSRHLSVGLSGFVVVGFVSALFLLVLWSFLLFLVC